VQRPNVLIREQVPPGAQPDPGSGEPPRVPATALYNGVAVAHVEDLVQQHLERGIVVRALVGPRRVESPELAGPIPREPPSRIDPE
jgi:hypothetical protein